jgi:lipopolysaccharide heptosyltransferase III
MAESDRPSFFERTRFARKVMVLDLGFLGDTVHLLPALWMVRKAYPEAELHVAVAEHAASLMDCTPWVDRVWGYPRFPKHARLGQSLGTVRRLRRERFDAVVNLNGSDRSSWLTFLSGAPERLGRVPSDGGPLFWRQLFTEIVEHPDLLEPVYLQRCHCLRKVGFPFEKPEFRVEIPPLHLKTAGIAPEDARTYFHLSPFSSGPQKELPQEQMAELIAALTARFPGKRWVISGGPTERERRKMAELLSRLSREPWKVFPGSLNLMQLAAVIQHSALHLSADSGPLHLAVMTGVPTVSWFRPSPGMQSFMPVGEKHRTVVGQDGGPAGLKGVSNADLIEAAHQVLPSVQQSNDG